LLKFKEWYDFQVHFAVHLKTSGEGGLVFRYKDFFNYYMVLLGENRIRFSKISNGKKILIKEIKTDILQDQWYRVWVKVNRFNLSVFMKQEDNPKDPIGPIESFGYPVFEAED